MNQDLKNQVTTLEHEHATRIANTSDASQRAYRSMSYQKDLLLQAEATTRFALTPLEKTQQQLDPVQQQVLTEQRAIEADGDHSLDASSTSSPSSLSPSPTSKDHEEQRDILGRLPDPSLQGGDCFC